MTGWFDRFAAAAARVAGSPYAFLAALLLVLAWAAAGPWFGWSDSHSLFINTTTTIGTWLLCFLIQATQNRDQEEMKRELRELVRAVPGARDEIAGCEQENQP
jgi:low affinity Fe/Cu permease